MDTGCYVKLTDREYSESIGDQKNGHSSYREIDFFRDFKVINFRLNNYF